MASITVHRGAGGESDYSPDGWTQADETWTYASATTFTISGDKTGTYSVGDKIKLTQTTVKYFYIVRISYGAPNTTITVTGGSDYSLANVAITSPYFSKDVSPAGFPIVFQATPTAASGVSSTSQLAAAFTITGKEIYLYFYVWGASNATNFSATLPIDISGLNTYNFEQLVSAMAGNSGASVSTYTCSATLGAGSSPTVQLTFYRGGSSTGWTASGDKWVRGYYRGLLI